MPTAKPTQKRSYGTGSIREKNGSLYFRFRPFPDKPQVERKVCRVGELGSKAIEKRCRQIEAEYKPAEDTEGIPTMAQVGTAHIKQLELDGKAKSYTKGRKRYLRLYVEPFFGEWPVDNPKVADIKRWKRWMQEAGKGPATIISAMWLISGIFKFAMEEEWRTDNPVASVAKPENPNTHKVVYMTPAEVNRLIAHVPDDELGKVERVLYRAGQKSGMRRCELLALKWDDCDFYLDVFNVERGYVEGEFTKTTKGKKSRTVPMVADLKLELESWRKRTRYPRPHHLVFGNPITGEPLEPSKITKRFNACLLNAGVGPVEYKVKTVKRNDRKGKTYSYRRAHPVYEFRDLRDTTGAALMSNPKISPREVQEILGHANLSTTSARYGAFVPTADLAERMASSFEDRQVVPTEEATVEA